jgi:carbonic anhydrase/acetyltransferase-like protein (isoleucine patch superfamily)
MSLYEYQGIRPRLGKNVFVAPNASVIGDVTLGDDASVWFGVTIRGDLMPIKFGARTNVQDGCVVHVTGGQAATTVGDDVTIGHLALIHGCTVGNGCLIGMGAILLDNCEIGDESIVAAGSLIAPRTKIPPRSMVMGRPGKVVRAITDQDLVWVRGSVQIYVDSARAFSDGSVKRIEG